MGNQDLNLIDGLRGFNMNNVKILTGSTGLNTKVDPVRIAYDPKTGVSELGVAVNVTLDVTGRISRRKGYTLAQAGNYHSLYCNGGDCFVVLDRTNDDALMQVGTDLSLKGVRSGLNKARMSFLDVDGTVFYANGFENGMIINGISHPWMVNEHVGAETTRHFSEAPIGNHLEYFYGRIFIAVGDTLYWSEPYAYGKYDLTRCFVQFSSKITMVKAVEGGLFVSDQKDTWFLRGTDPSEFTQAKVAAYPAYEWSVAIDYIEAGEIGYPPGLSVMWVSKQGACLGHATGLFFNLTKEKVDYPANGAYGAGIIKDYKFIHTIEV